MLSSQGAHPVRHHPQVLVAALTFCFGLFLVRVGLAWWGPVYFSAFHHPWSDPLIVLGVVAGIATIAYLLLRADEGDFTALLVVSLLLFAVEELLTFFSRSYGVLTFKGFANLLAFCAAIYSSLALTAVVYEGPGVQRDESSKLAIGATTAIFVLAALRALTVVVKQNNQRYLEWTGEFLLAAAIVYLALGLARSYRHVSSAKQKTPIAGGGPAGASSAGSWDKPT